MRGKNRRRSFAEFRLLSFIFLIGTAFILSAGPNPAQAAPKVDVQKIIAAMHNFIGLAPEFLWIATWPAFIRNKHHYKNIF